MKKSIEKLICRSNPRCSINRVGTKASSERLWMPNLLSQPLLFMLSVILICRVVNTMPNNGNIKEDVNEAEPWQPGMVQKMKLIENGSSSIIVSWEPPKVANGELTNYIVKASLIYDDPELLQQRNFCDEPLGWNEVFPTSQRTIDKEKSPNDFVESKIVDGYYVEFYNNQTNAYTHTFTLEKLRHFSMYSVSVQACRDFDDPSFNIETFCSNVVTLNRRTAKIDDADKIDQLNLKKLTNSNTGRSTVVLNWEEPENPNGLILSYTIIYKRVDLDNVKPTEQCIARHLYTRIGGNVPFLQLSNGNYSVSVRATSLAGDGPPTQPTAVILAARN